MEIAFGELNSWSAIEFREILLYGPGVGEHKCNQSAKVNGFHER
jgi:hypothetical protein